MKNVGKPEEEKNRGIFLTQQNDEDKQLVKSQASDQVEKKTAAVQYPRICYGRESKRTKSNASSTRQRRINSDF